QCYCQITFQKTYGGIRNEGAYSVERTTDSGYIITGFTNSFGDGGLDVYLVKTDFYGDLIWAKSYGGSDMDVGRFVRQTFDGGYVILGETRSFGNGNSQVYLIKTDAGGNMVWSKTFGGNSHDFYVSTVYQTMDSGYVLAAYTYPDFNAEIIKTNS